MNGVIIKTFCDWYYNNYYSINNEIMCLDKDILFKGNKIYSPETCIFVPQRINTLFIKCNSKRGDLPIGVYFNKRDSCYEARCSDKNIETKNLGCFNNSFDAFQAYKQFKEMTIKQIADEYKYVIPEVLYNVMYNYIVEIDD